MSFCHLGHNVYKALRRADLPPRAFQLRASQCRDPYERRNGSKTGFCGKVVATSGVSSRHFSITSPSRKFDGSVSPKEVRRASTRLKTGNLRNAVNHDSPQAAETMSVHGAVEPASNAFLDDFGHPGKMSPQPSLQNENELPGSIIQHRTRSCMRLVPQPAVIVTATDVNDVQNPWRGATVSSFATVTFEPNVVVSLNLKLPSATFDAICASHRFDVNLMKSNNKAVEMAARFAKGHTASPFGDAATDISVFNRKREREVSSGLPPVLYQSTGEDSPIAFSLSCTYTPQSTFQLGDHVVVFGVVNKVPATSDNDTGGEANTCLAYVNGSYGRVEALLKESSQCRGASDEGNALFRSRERLLSRHCSAVHVYRQLKGLRARTRKLVRLFWLRGETIVRAFDMAFKKVQNPGTGLPTFRDQLGYPSNGICLVPAYYYDHQTLVNGWDVRSKAEYQHREFGYMIQRRVFFDQYKKARPTGETAFWTS